MCRYCWSDVLAEQGEPYATEAVIFTREHVNQRDVDLYVETVNKGGTFLGTLTVPGPKPFDLGLGLVENGLAAVHPFFDASTPSGRQLFIAEKNAKDKKLKVLPVTGSNFLPFLFWLQSVLFASDLGELRSIIGSEG